MREKMKVLVMLLVVFGIIGTALVLGQPLGATLTEGPSSRGSNSTLDNTTAQGGNVTSVNVNQQRITGIWQGFYGNVTGSIVLENAAGNNFYDWNTATLGGEILASRDIVSSWNTLNCSNSTHWEQEESFLEIESTDSDGVNETYATQGGHPDVTIASRTISGCRATRPWNSSGTAGNWWNLLLFINTTNTTVYTALINNTQDAFEGGTADYEILVPVNETAGQSIYWFYAELG